MYNYALPVGALSLLAGLALFAYVSNQPLEVDNEVIEVPTEEVAPDCLTVVGDQDACDAAAAVIKKKELERELEVVKGEISDKQAEVDALEARRVDLEKRIGTY